MFGFIDIEFFSQFLQVIGQERVRGDFLEFFIIEFEGHALARQVEGELFLDSSVIAHLYHLIDHILLIEFECETQGRRILLLRKTNLIADFEGFLHFQRVNAVEGTVVEVLDNPFGILAVNEREDLFQLVHFEQKVNSRYFGVILHEVRDHFTHQSDKMIHGFFFFLAFFEVSGDLAGEIIEVLEAPAEQAGAGSLE